ncbi:MAG: YwbE family protein [Methanomicrobium sp.]|nr:YwbE family protein [Methanomicrobium sp.]
MADNCNIADKNPGQRINIKQGISVQIVLKKDQMSGKLTKGIVKEILTNSSFHPHGIKVRLLDGSVGRVQKIE